jgi:hypothetical protein
MPATSKKNQNWSAEVTHNSNALDLENHIFTSSNPRHIALSLKHSAEVSQRRKGSPFQSAMSMLNFYLNRGGKGLAKKQKLMLEKAKIDCAGRLIVSRLTISWECL